MTIKSYRLAINEALSTALAENEQTYLIGEDIGLYGGGFSVTAGLIEKFGRTRVLETPISESAIAGVATGSAMMGLRPIVELHFSDFITIAMDQLINQAAKMHYLTNGKLTVPLVVRSPFGTGTGAGCQHSQSLESWFTHVPGLVVVAPANPYDAKGLLLAAIDDDNPVIFFEHKALYDLQGEVPDDSYRLPLGKAEIKCYGRDLTIIATSRMVNRCLVVAKKLREQGIFAEVIDPRTLVPLDRLTIIKSAKKTGRVLIVTEEVKNSGFGAELVASIAESAAFSHLIAPIKRLGAKFTPVPVVQNLEEASIPQISDIIQASLALLTREKTPMIDYRVIN